MELLRDLLCSISFAADASTLILSHLAHNIRVAGKQRIQPGKNNAGPRLI